ncbi:universal stress protein [Dyella sp. A6]|uniref:universal stress protein n=1 Tax=Dyella aluminiiresistens TaxID=3069105 RepID=UPI002E78EBC0|nr:universal stress protein [Dyella sp. A6]
MYANLLVYLDLDRDNTALLKIVGDLAERFGAGVTGVTASQPVRIIYGDGLLTGDIVELDRTEIRQAMAKAHEQFQAALQGRAKRLAWRSDVSAEMPTDYVARQVRSADLVITHTDYDKAYFDESRHVNAGNLIMQAGRPVLTVPAAAGSLAAKHLLVAWKDTSEARRAVASALPFLKQAQTVTVAEVTDTTLAEAPNGARDVAEWLKLHGVPATSVVERAHGRSADQLLGIALANSADLIVAGAYGHNRLREWALGGVTYNLLAECGMCTLMSH